MAELILDNLGTVAVGLILLAVVVLILLGMRKEKKAGKRGCCGGCAGCSGACVCHKNKNVSSQENRTSFR